MALKIWLAWCLGLGLALAGEPAAHPLLERLAHAWSPEERAEAGQALTRAVVQGWRQDPEASARLAPHVATALAQRAREDPDPRVRAVAIGCVSLLYTHEDRRPASPASGWPLPGWIPRWIGETSLPALRAALGDPHPGVRAQAVRSYLDVLPLAGPALPELAAQLADDESDPRCALGTIGRLLERVPDADGTPAIPALRALLEDADREPDVRLEAAYVLALTGALPPEPATDATLHAAQVALGEATWTDDSPSAVDVAERLGPRAAWAAPYLLEALDRPDLVARDRLPRALAAIGSAARAAGPRLRSWALDPSEYLDLRVECVNALPRLGGAGAARETLLALLGSANAPDALRLEAAHRLGEQGEQRALPLLRGLVRGASTSPPAADSWLVSECAASVGRLALSRVAFDGGLEAAAVAAELIALLRLLLPDVGTGETLCGVLTGLGWLGVYAAPAIPHLRSPELQGSFLAVEALGALQRIAPEASVAPYAALLKGRDAEARRLAAQRLGELGALTASAVPALRAGLVDTDPLLRLRAAEALGRVGAPAAAARDDLILAASGDVVFVAEAARASLAAIDAACGD